MSKSLQTKWPERLQKATGRWGERLSWRLQIPHKLLCPRETMRKPSRDASALDEKEGSYDAQCYQTKNGCTTLLPDAVGTTRKEEGSLGSHSTVNWLSDFGPAERQCIIGECVLDPTQPIAAQKQRKREGTEVKCSPHVTPARPSTRSPPT